MPDTDADHITRLAELAREQADELDATHVVWECEGGEACEGIGLLRLPEVGVVRATIPRGATFRVHTHPSCSEWLLVYAGIVEAELWGEDLETPRLIAGDGVRVWPGMKHCVHAVTEVGIIGVTIPCEEGYPFGPDTGGTAV